MNENLDYEKPLRIKLSMVIKRFNGTETLRNIVAQLEAKAVAAGDTLILKADDDIDVYADYDRFVQIMVNIIQKRDTILPKTAKSWSPWKRLS